MLCCVIATLFGYFFAIPSLHALSFLNDFFQTFIIQCAIMLQNIYYHLNG